MAYCCHQETLSLSLLLLLLLFCRSPLLEAVPFAPGKAEPASCFSLAFPRVGKYFFIGLVYNTAGSLGECLLFCFVWGFFFFSANQVFSSGYLHKKTM